MMRGGSFLDWIVAGVNDDDDVVVDDDDLGPNLDPKRHLVMTSVMICWWYNLEWGGEWGMG